MSEQNKIDINQIKADLEATTPDWYYNGNEIVTEQNLRIGIGGFLKEEDNQLAGHAQKYITYLLQVIERKDEATRKAINIWETATPEDDFDDTMHAVIDELKDSLAL